MTPLHGIACFYDVGFGARAVSRKTPIYFIVIVLIIQPAREAREPEGRAREARKGCYCQSVPHSEVGQDFLLRRRVTLTETAVTRKRKV